MHGLSVHEASLLFESGANADGTVSRWTLAGSGAGELTTAEREHVRRIAGT